MRYILLLVVLTGCVVTPVTPQAGVGGVDAQTESLLAGATQTSAAARIEQTAISKQTTAQAIYAQQTAVSSYATATAQYEIQATQQAYAQETAIVATETALYVPVSLRQTEEAQTVLMQREALNTQATATAVMLAINNEAAAAMRWGYFWNGIMAVLVVIGFAIAIGFLGQAFKQWRGAEFVEDGNGHIVAIDKRLAETRNVRTVSRPVLLENPEHTAREPMYTAPTPTRPVTFTSNGNQTKINVPDNNPGIDPFKWQCFAAAVLIDEVPPTRRAITESNNYISQADHKAMYDYLIDNDLARTGAGDALILDIGEGYEFLYNKLSPHLQGDVGLPHPSGLTPVTGER